MHLVISLLSDGVSILYGYAGGIIAFLTAVLGLGLLTVRFAADPEEGKPLRILIALSLGGVVLSLISYALVIIAHSIPIVLRPGSILVLIVSAIVCLHEIWPMARPPYSGLRLFVLSMLALFVLLVLRLVFLKHILLPPYSDSVLHFQIVQSFLQPGLGSDTNLSLENLSENYYHFGFHALVAWLTSVSGIDPLVSIPLLGQLFLVIAPASVALLTYTVTREKISALAAGVLGASGWFMPAFAANWGKYPAISALATAPGLIATFWLLQRKPANRVHLLILGFLLLIGITLMHSRIVIVLFLAAVCVVLSNRVGIKQGLSLAQAIRFSLLYVISLSPLYDLLREFYVVLPISIVLLGLLPFAFQSYPRVSFGIFFFTFSIWLVKLAPAVLPGHIPTLLNDQFVEIMLYAPFSVISGAGFGGLITKLPGSGLLRWIAAGVPILLLLWNLSTGRSILPDPCCEYYGENDQAAFQWIRDHATDRSLILTSSFWNEGKFFGTDAGIWISPLTGTATNRLPFNINWQLADDLEEICRAGAREIYIYAGGRQFSFRRQQLGLLAWAQPVFQARETVIYQVASCEFW